MANVFIQIHTGIYVHNAASFMAFIVQLEKSRPTVEDVVYIQYANTEQRLDVSVQHLLE